MFLVISTFTPISCETTDDEFVITRQLSDAKFKINLLIFSSAGISFTDRTPFDSISTWAEGQEASDSEKLSHEDEAESSLSSVQFTLGATE